MANQFIGRYRDYDNDVKQTSINLIGTADRDDAILLGVELNKWSRGAEGGQYFKDELLGDNGVAATSPIAQGAMRIIFEMTDSVSGRAYKETLPMPTLDKANDGDSKKPFIVSGGLTMLNPAHADYITTKAQLDANWQSPEGNAGTLSRAYIEE